MKTPEDEAFEELERKQNGFQAKRAAAAKKLHSSDCAVHNGPAYPAGPCDCGVAQEIVYAADAFWEKDGRIGVVLTITRPDGGVHLLQKTIDPPQSAQEPDWKDQYEKQKRRAEMWIAKYEKDIGLLERVKPMHAEPAQEACDMGAMCLGCEPRNPDGSCPDARPAQEDEEVCSHCGSYRHERDALDKAEREIVRLQKMAALPAQEPYCYVDPVHLAALNTHQSALVTLHKNPSGYASRGLHTTPPKRERVVFPTMLRKMWSGGEVQAWLDENVNKEKNT